MDSLVRSGAGGLTTYSNPRAWIVAGIAVAGVIILAEAARRRRRWLRGRSTTPPHNFGAFCDSLELSPLPQAPPPAARQQLSDLTFVVSDNFEIEGYVAGFRNPDWKRTQTAASRTVVAVTNLLKQGATCVGRTVMDELGFGPTRFCDPNCKGDVHNLFYYRQEKLHLSSNVSQKLWIILTLSWFYNSINPAYKLKGLGVLAPRGFPACCKFRFQATEG